MHRPRGLCFDVRFGAAIMQTEFDEVDARIRAMGASLLSIGDALLTRPEDVYVCWPDGDDPPEPNEETSLGLADPLPTKEEIRDLLKKWRALLPDKKAAA